ncbi:MAG TPA: TetR/AcrR family transcriptional regulator [Thermoleophilaceae bacterium]|nr:TetR/AcrR family transcriptional regulator [Thermoleophilaceae bacterium]
MSATIPERRRMPTAERRAVILATAGPLFAEDGYAGTRLDDVAAAAGVTKPILYRHFDSKKALYIALLDKHEADLPSFFERVAGVAPDLAPDALVRLILEHWLDYVRENRHAWAMLFRDASGDDELRQRRLEVSARAREVMAGFVAAVGGDRVPAEQIEPTAEMLTSGLAGLALWWIERPDVPKRTVVDVAARLCVPAVAS